MTTTTAPVRPRLPAKISLLWIIPVLVAAAAIALVVNLSQSTPDEQSLTVRNATGAEVTLSVSGDGSSWLPLGTLDPRSRETFDSVVDQGDRWRIRMTVGPTRLGELRRTKAQLEAADWQVTVPADAANQLPPDRRAG